MSWVNPTRPGIFTFRGRRYSATRKSFITVRDIVEVKRLTWGKESPLVVVFFGKNNFFDLRRFEGSWEPVRLEIEGGRTT